MLKLDNLDVIFTRESVRDFSDKQISKEEIDVIIRAAMSGPTCVNSRDYAFIVVDQKEILTDIYNLLGPQSKSLLCASHAIVILRDISRSFKSAPEYNIIDTSIAAQNIMLAANALNIGSVMLGVWPQEDRVEKIDKYFNLPESVSTTSVIALGYKKDITNGKNHFESDRIHYNKY